MSVDDVPFPLDKLENVEDDFEDFPLDGEEIGVGDAPYIVDLVIEEEELT